MNAPYGILLVHNGNLTNVRELQQDLFHIDRRHLNSDSDTELLVNVLANELQSQLSGLELDPDQVFTAVAPRARARRGLLRRDRADRRAAACSRSATRSASAR